jgi:chromate transporter
VKEIAAVFLRLGFFGFGGPAAHISMMEELVVEKGKWLDREHFLDLVGLTNLIPGPNSTEMVIHLGLLRGGWRGMLLAGACFLAPAIGLTALLAVAYAKYGQLDFAQALAAGIQPAVIAVILVAGWRLAKTAVKGPIHLLLGIAVAASALLGAPEIAALFVGAIVGTLLLARTNNARTNEVISLFLFFLWVGSVLYGSGYLLVAFVESKLVPDLLTADQLLDAIAIGQFTPGPVLSTATFIGYQIDGWLGAVAATVGIFAPSFLLVAIFHPIFARLRKSEKAKSFLDAVKVSAVALLAAVLFRLGKQVFIAPFPVAVFVAAAVLGIRFKLSSVWLIAGGAALGLARSWMT